jgi:hypothetical protein
LSLRRPTVQPQPLGAGAVHTPDWQVPIEHAVPSASAGVLQLPVSGAHWPAAWHSSAAVHFTAVPRHVPLAHESPVVHLSPSSQVAPSGLFTVGQVPSVGRQVAAR